MADRIYVCLSCAKQIGEDDLAGSGFACPHCGGEQFSMAVRSMQDLADLPADEITVESHLCLTWARIAVDAALRAVAVAPDVDREFGESLLACTAAAHAIDAFYGGFLRYAPARLTTAKGTSRNSIVLEGSKLAFKIGAWGNANVGELKWLYRLRDDAVHFNEVKHPPAVHHSGVVVSAEMAHWSSPSATRAVKLMLGYMTVCAANPKAPGPLRAWADDVGQYLPAFRRRFAGEDV